MRVSALLCICTFWVVSVVAQLSDLEHLYQSTNGDQWFNNTNWLSGDPCLDGWFGITCVNGSITELDLTNNNLDGTLPPTLDIPTLSKLYLGFNANLTGDLPVYTNANLSEIYLNNTQIHGGFPNWLSNLPYLTTISLSNTNLSGEFPLVWCSMTQLQALSLGKQNLFGTLPNCIGNLTSLQTLEIFSTPLKGVIPESITNLVNLQHLELYYNLLSGTIPQNIGHMKDLVTVTLYDNEFEGTLPASLGSLTKLELIRFRNNKLSGEIPQTFEHLKNLNNLGLESNYITGTIPEWLSPEQMPKLMTLDLRCNKFVGPLPTWLKTDPATNSNIQVWFGCNNITTNDLPKWCLDQTRCGQSSCDGSRCSASPVQPTGPNKLVIVTLACFLGLLLLGNVTLIVFLVRKRCMRHRDPSELPILGLKTRY